MNPSTLSEIYTVIVVVLALLFVAYHIYKWIYFRSESFLSVKNSIKKNTEQCNSLNDHIEELKNTYVATKKVDYGQADYNDLSRWNYKRPEWKKLRDASNIYNCSLPVCSNAKKQPFKYLCKYFDIKANEENLTNFESILNDFSAAEQGKVLLKKERDETVVGIRDRIPFLIRIFSRKKLLAKLGFDEIDFSQLYFPRYSFKYVSAGGNSSTSCDIVLDIENLDKFVNYLAELVKFRKSVAGQRALMTSRLREEIKKRDAYRCKRCGVSVSDEPNLLLEIDHITPLSRGGMTTEKNLQTLCWRCNRSKGAKLVDIDNVPV